MESFVTVPPWRASRVADFGGVQLYRLIPDKIVACSHPSKRVDLEFREQLVLLKGVPGDMKPDLGDIVEGNLCLRVNPQKGYSASVLLPALSVQLEATRWCFTFAAVSNRERICAGVFAQEGSTIRPLAWLRPNNVTGPINHIFGDTATRRVLRPPWYPSCWLTPLPAGGMVFYEWVQAFDESRLDGLQSYIVSFEEGGGAR